MVAMEKPESLENMINIAVKIDDRQHDKFVNKKTWSKPIPKNNPQFKRDLMELNVTEEIRFKKKPCYVCGKLGHLKRNCPKKTIKMSEKWIEMTEKPETAIKVNHENLSWTTCSDDRCGLQRSFKKKLNGIQKKEKYLEKAKYIKQILPNKNTSHSGNNNQN